MRTTFAPVLLVGILGALFVFGTMLLSFILRPLVPNQNKSDIYECGERPVGGAWVNTNIRFYVIALIFLIFEVEIAFMYPVASVYRKWVQGTQGALALFEVLAFVLVLFVAIVYAWVKGDLEWVSLVGKTKISGPDANAVPINLRSETKS